MKFLVASIIIAGLLVVYFYWIRPHLKSLPQFADLYAKEGSVLAALGAWLHGRRTILAGIWGEVAAWLPDMLQVFANVDLKTAFGLPDNWALIIGAIIVPILMLIFRTMAKPVN